MDEAIILLVEDNPGDVRLVREALSESGPGRDHDHGGLNGDGAEHELHVVSNGAGALEFCFRRGDHADAPRPTIVLLDLNLPRTGGQAVLAELKADPLLRRIPVIVWTSSNVDADVVDAYENRANAFIWKPTDPLEFIEAIRALERFWLSTATLTAIVD
ncbi:response regulator [Natrialbaceae archaeon GCM10025810]|uniref:response regulator n=1 Tax=Halovalidus salilacus TaxID=3075124 RepID=UPI00360A9FCB